MCIRVVCGSEINNNFATCVFSNQINEYNVERTSQIECVSLDKLYK